MDTSENTAILIKIHEGTLFFSTHSMKYNLTKLRGEAWMNVDKNVAKLPERHHERPCMTHETEIKNVRLAHAYVPFQNMCETFSPFEAFKRGTIFPELYNVYGWRRKGTEDDIHEC